MNVTTALHRNSYLVFASFLICALWAFWPGYFSAPLQVTLFRLQVHAITGTLWCVMLVTQAFLIRTNYRDVHRLVGSVSYVLAPLFVISTVVTFHNSTQGDGRTVEGLHFLALVMGEVVLFSLAYGLAMYHRASPAIHARYMVLTPLPLIGPVFNRLIGRYAGEYLAAAGVPTAQWITVPATLAIVAALGVWDWKSNQKLNVFPLMFIAFLVFLGGTYIIYRFPMWARFVDAFLELPIS